MRLRRCEKSDEIDRGKDETWSRLQKPLGCNRYLKVRRNVVTSRRERPQARVRGVSDLLERREPEPDLLVSVGVVGNTTQQRSHRVDQIAQLRLLNEESDAFALG